MSFLVALIIAFGQSLEALPKAIVTPEPKWEDVTEKIPGGVEKALFFASKTESCLVVLSGEELRFSTGKGARWGNDVIISKKNGVVSYKSGLGGKALKSNDPVFAHCASRVKAASEFTPELRALFLGFGGIK